MLILVRHGRTAVNASRRLQGRGDAGLDETGIRQAVQIAAQLDRPFRLISSPLRRALETAAAFDMPVETDERWIEYDYGVLEGTPLGDVPTATWERWRTDPNWAPAGGESHGQVTERVVEACNELIRDSQDHTIVVVTHVTPIKAALGWVLGLPPTSGNKTYLDVASITRFEARPYGPVLRTFNETSHLS